MRRKCYRFIEKKSYSSKREFCVKNEKVKKMAENEEIAQQLAAAQLNEGGTNNDVEMESCSGTSGYKLFFSD